MLQLPKTCALVAVALLSSCHFPLKKGSGSIVTNDEDQGGAGVVAGEGHEQDCAMGESVDFKLVGFDFSVGPVSVPGRPFFLPISVGDSAGVRLGICADYDNETYSVHTVEMRDFFGVVKHVEGLRATDLEAALFGDVTDQFTIDAPNFRIFTVQSGENRLIVATRMQELDGVYQPQTASGMAGVAWAVGNPFQGQLCPSTTRVKRTTATVGTAKMAFTRCAFAQSAGTEGYQFAEFSIQDNNPDLLAPIDLSWSGIERIQDALEYQFVHHHHGDWIKFQIGEAKYEAISDAPNYSTKWTITYPNQAPKDHEFDQMFYFDLTEREH